VGLWDHACSYAPVNKPYAICNVPTNSHSWQPAASDHGSFVCAKVTNDPKPNASIFVDPYPTGFVTIAQASAGLCAYTSSNKPSALCNVPAAGYGWTRPYHGGNPGFLCARETSQSIEVTLGSLNGYPPRVYQFTAVPRLTSPGTKDSYSDLMIGACNLLGMKPVCEHPSMCEHDDKALYLGQDGHLSIPAERNSMGRNPMGFAKIRNQWAGLCSYTGAANGNRALCNAPANSHTWKSPIQADPGFMCARVIRGLPFRASLGGVASAGVAAATYEFQMAMPVGYSNEGSKYAVLMKAACKQYGMKPVCDHRSYCGIDADAIYLGQPGHMASAPRTSAAKLPAGFAKIRHHWASLCSYTSHYYNSGARALCNRPLTSISWWDPRQYNPGFMCAKDVSDNKNCYVDLPAKTMRGTCPESSKLLADATTCSGVCAAGTKLPFKCAEGKVSTPNRCCAAGSVWNGTATECSKCPPGRSDHDSDPATECVLCEAGRYSTDGAKVCANCPAGTHGLAGGSSQSECTACPKGRYDHDANRNPNANSAWLPKGCYAIARLLGGNGELQRGKLVGSVDLGTEFTIGFDITPSSAVTPATASILHLTFNNQDKGGRSRVPALFFHAKSRKLLLVDSTSGAPTSGDFSAYCDETPLPANKKSSIKIVSSLVGITLAVNGKQVCSDSWNHQTRRRSLSGVKVYLADPWYAPAKAVVKNLHIIDGTCGVNAASTPCIPCRGSTFANTTGSTGSDCPFTCKSAGSFTRTDESWRQGLHFDAYQYKDGILQDWEQGVHDRVWNNQKPALSHRSLDVDLWFPTEESFMGVIPHFGWRDQ
jgi:hypothetical protein